MELMVLRSRPAALGLLRPRVHRLPSASSCSDSFSFPTTKSFASPIDTNCRFLQCHTVPSSSMKALATASVASASEVSKQKGASKEKDVIFVAGSTGKVGSRLVRELLKLGFRVRAGVRSAQRAGSLVGSVKQMKPADSTQAPQERLEIVECDLENQSAIQSAIANASVVICCIGASEKEVLDITGPYRIDYKATSNLIQEATKLKVDHFILLTSLGTGAIGFPASLLNLFWGVLCWKRKAEEELIASGLPYTIVRPGGMERPTDSFKETHNLVLANENTYFGGLVSNLQVAELMAFMAKNGRLSYCKVVEVIAETTAPLLPMEQLLSTIPSQRPLPPDPEPASRPEPEPKPGPEPEPAPKPEPESDPVQMSKPGPQSAYTVVDSKDSETLLFVFEPESAQGSKPMPVSPYTAYEDLKPPSTPTPPQPKTEPKSTASYSVDKPVSMGSTVSLSPYPSYADLKPPSSPSPSAPNNGTTISISKSKSGNPSPTAAKIKAYPLSPYTMYEDLKPPTSPVPSVPNY